VSVPGADELFRRTVVPHQDEPADITQVPSDTEVPRAPSGRIRHDEKMTVYVTAEELLDLEGARLSLRRAGLSVDRGRLVREAIAIALADLEHHGDDSLLVHRLTQA
jgi:hypothetical protein